METFGQRLANYRKQKSLTQNDIADKLNFSYQAISKWENDLTAPDLDSLVKLSEILDVSVDELLGKKKKETAYDPSIKDNMDKAILRIVVESSENDKVRVNLPVALLKAILNGGISNNFITGNKALEGIDLNQIIQMIDCGVVGELVSVDSKEGDHVSIFVEKQ